MQSKKEIENVRKKKVMQEMLNTDIYLTFHEKSHPEVIKADLNQELSEKFGVAVSTIYNVRHIWPYRISEMVRKYPEFQDRYDSLQQRNPAFDKTVQAVEV